MASSGNPNQQPQPQQQQQNHFDFNKLFKAPTTSPSASSPSPSIPNSSNLNTSPSFPAPSPSTPPPSSYPTPSSSYPPPTGTYPYHHPHFLPYPQLHHHQQQHQEHPLILHHLPQMHAPQRPPIFQPPSPSSPHPLMALLGTQNPPSNQEPPVVYTSPSTSSPSPSPSHVASDFPNPAGLPSTQPSGSPVTLASAQSTPARMLSTKLPKGRHLIGEHVVYDIDVRMPGEVQPQLEVTPITKYASDPGLVLGRQIAVNKSYICYGLKLGAIRVLNINTALRYLLRGHTQVGCVALHCSCLWS
uniref:Uncharacterized protein n=1 Tax=Cajanus cajan TaxID=3821 RepID=A0A151T6W3_CAJCA|nr:hypothetical protein KK1_017343 [Cajanus cajan]